MLIPRSKPPIVAWWRLCTAIWPALCWWALVLALLCRLGEPGFAWGAGTPAETPAQALAGGWDAFARGNFAGAATHWEQAARLYAETRQPQARGRALTLLARAYAALGHADRAEENFRTALELARAAQDRPQIALILGLLGDLAVATGNVVEAELLVREALLLAQTLEDPGLIATLEQTQGTVLMAQQHWPDALTVYRTSARVARQAAQWGMAARALAHAAMAAERAEQPQTAIGLLSEAMEVLQQASPSHETVADLLVIGHTYHRLAQTQAGLILQAAAAFQQAATLAQAQQDTRTLSAAWGALGRLYEEAQRYDEAIAVTRRAALAAQRVDAPELLYQWQWQTGRILRALGQVPSALDVYARAVETVQTLHAPLMRGPWGLQGTFREVVGPLYVEQADLLLQQAARLETQPQARALPQYAAYLRQAQETIELFKGVELRDYFGDACVDAVRPRTTALEYVSPDTAVVYPILLTERTELLVHIPTGLTRVGLSVPGRQVAQRAQFLRSALEARDPERSLQHAQRLYQWLIQPLESALAEEAIRTLVFVPDGALRLIPPAVLHDGQRYLIEKYATAITPSLTLTEPHPLPQGAIQVLAAGLAETAYGLPPLPAVREELHALQTLYGGSVLLDQAFSPARLDALLLQGRFTVVHLATHGHFAAKAEESFLLTAQGKLTLPHLAQSLGRLRFREQPVELLTLSACETAQGDDRAALGLAGVAIQAGARSALATLWQVADAATARLMEAFYQHLHTPGTSKARALQQAQVQLLQDSRYAEPFFWAPFLLINNWL